MLKRGRDRSGRTLTLASILFLNDEALELFKQGNNARGALVQHNFVKICSKCETISPMKGQ